MLVDSHCHIHDAQFYPDSREAVYSRAVEANVDMILVGTSEPDSRAAVEFASSHDSAWAVVGVHPHDTKDGWGDIGQILKEKPNKLVGIGEIGLDYFYNNSPRDVQTEALEQQLQWASDYSLPISFHVRDAFDDFWPIFDNFSGLRGVLHSFTDTVDTLEQAFKRNLLIGVNGISTFTKNSEQRELFAGIPLEKMLLETDAPFLTPLPYRGKVNEPAFVRKVAEHHALVRDCSVDKVINQTTKNARALFAL